MGKFSGPVLSRYDILTYIISLLLSCSAVFAAANPLLGRWELVAESSAYENMAILQFEREGKLIVEARDGNNIAVTSAPYTLDSEQENVSIPDYFTEGPAQIHLEGDLLSLNRLDGQVLSFRELKEPRVYATLAHGDGGRLLPVTQLDIDAEILGKRAITNAIYTIKNNFKDDLKVSFNLSLPEGATVMGYALDLRGQMVDAVAVPKRELKKNYTALGRGKSDESMDKRKTGKPFSIEINSVPGKGFRKVSVRYVENLEAAPMGAYDYRLLLQQVDSNAAINIALTVDRVVSEPKVKTTPFETFQWEKAKSADRYYSANAIPFRSRRNVRHDNFVLRIEPINYHNLVYALGPEKKRNYYSTEFSFDETLLENIAPPQHVTILWDVSASMADRHKTNYKLLLQYLKALNKQYAKPPTINLLSFSNDIVLQKEFDLLSDGYKQIAAILKNTIYDGATRYDILSEALLSGKTDIAILFSDGIPELGRESTVKSNVPTYVISDEGNNNYSALYAVASKQGGLLLNTDTLSNKKIVGLLGKTPPPMNFFLNNQKVRDNIFTQLSVGTELNMKVAGSVASTGAEIDHLRFSVHVGGQEVHAEQANLKPDYGRVIRFDYLEMYLNQLLGDAIANKAEIISLAKANTLVTPYTKLRVLGDIQEYVALGVSPPKSFSGTHKYAELHKQDKANRAEGEEVFNHLHAMWKHKLDWWSQFDKPPVLEEIKQQFLAVEKDGLIEASPFVSEAPATGYEEIELLPGFRDKPYIDELKSTVYQGEAAIYKKYLSLRKKYSGSPVFFLDVAQYFYESHYSKRASRILSNLLERYPGNVELKRMVASVLVQFEEFDDAVAVLEQVALLQPQKVSSFRDLAMLWEKKARLSNEAEDFQQAIKYYYGAITRPLSEDQKLQVVALTELNHLLNSVDKEELEKLNLPESLLANLELDLRIVLSWNLPGVEVALRVEEPSGEEVSFGSRSSLAGGQISYCGLADFGPQLYLKRHALEGAYKLFAELSSGSSPELFGPLVLTIDVYTDYGRATEKLQTTTLNVTESGQRIALGSISHH